jgi:hypothetical protein
MSIRIPCWDRQPETSAGRGIIIVPEIDLTWILHRDVFYKGAYVKKTLINFFIENNNLDHNQIDKVIQSTREDTLTLSYRRDYPLRPHEETIKLVVCFFGAGLNCFKPDSTNIYNGEYFDTAKTHLEIDISDFKSFIKSNDLPLPSYLFPDESTNTLIFKDRLHNRKRFKEILSFDEIIEIVRQAPKKDKNHDKTNGLLPVITEYELNWNEIKITFIDEFTILIQFKDDAESRKFDRAGFKDQKTNKPIKAWKSWYEASKTSGLKFTFDDRKIKEKRAQEIRKKLKELFPKVKGNPIVCYRKEKIYKFAFQQIQPQDTYEERMIAEFCEQGLGHLITKK